PAEAWRATRDSQPVEVLRYAEYRLIGHPVLEAVLLPALQAARRRFEREPGPDIADLGKGQRPKALAPQLYDAAGVPLAAMPGDPLSAVDGSAPPLASADALRDGFAGAEAGDVLELAPGTYAIDRPLVTGHAGLPTRPITLRARRPGTVV